jgi:hypothetical protein
MSAEHGHYEEKENTEPDNINVGLVATVTIVGAILVAAIALALTALVRSEARIHSEAVEAFANLGGVKRLKAEQVGKLEKAPSWSDPGKGLVAIPITRAMDLVRTDIQKNPALATKPNPADRAAEGPDAGAAGADGGAAGESTTDETAPEGAKAPEKKKDAKESKGTKKPKAPESATPAPAPSPAPTGTEN